MQEILQVKDESSEGISSELNNYFQDYIDGQLLLGKNGWERQDKYFVKRFEGKKTLVFFLNKKGPNYSCKVFWKPETKIDGKLSQWFRVRVNKVVGFSIPTFWMPIKDFREFLKSTEHSLLNNLGQDPAFEGSLDDLDEFGNPLVKATIPVEVVDPDEPPKEVFHCEFGKMLKWTKTRKPCWFYGAAGGGKSHLGAQIAAALGIPFFPFPVGPTTTESRIFGFLNAGQGSYVEGALYKPFKYGGLWWVDEIDVLDAQVLISVNYPIAQDHYLFPNGEMVKKHDDFYVVAGANTIGKGAMGGYKRNSQDAASRDRWVKVKIGYDEALERSLCRNKEWPKYVQRVRKFVEGLAKDTVLITPRASYNGDAALSQGIGAQDVMEATIFAEMSDDVRKQVISNCGVFVMKSY